MINFAEKIPEPIMSHPFADEKDTASSAATPDLLPYRQSFLNALIT